MEMRARPPAFALLALALLVCSGVEPAAAAPGLQPAAYAGLAAEDAVLAASTMQRALERSMSNGSRRWQNPQTGASGMVTPLTTFRVADGRYCRDYLEVVVLAGRTPATSRGIACRSADGVWLPVLP
jgi:surface antigen